MQNSSIKAARHGEPPKKVVCCPRLYAEKP
jgi:hypothetical protein